jgi:hypothetical protein
MSGDTELSVSRLSVALLIFGAKGEWPAAGGDLPRLAIILFGLRQLLNQAGIV